MLAICAMLVRSCFISQFIENLVLVGEMHFCLIAHARQKQVRLIQVRQEQPHVWHMT